MYYKNICRKGGENFIKYETILEVEKLQARRIEKLYLSTKKKIKSQLVLSHLSVKS